MEFYRLHSSVIVVAANMNIHLSVFKKGSVAERFLSYGFSFRDLCCIFYVLIKVEEVCAVLSIIVSFRANVSIFSKKT